MQALDKYKNDGKMHKKAIRVLSTDKDLPAEQMALVQSAQKYGKRLGILTQLPVVFLLATLFTRKISKLPTDKKAISYLICATFYFNYYGVSESFAWHQARIQAEPVFLYYQENKPIDSSKSN